MKIRTFEYPIFLAVFSLSSSAIAQTQTEIVSVELYGGLSRGMKPEEASVAVLKLEGVKSAKVKKQKRPEAVMCVDVSHDMSKGGDYGGQKGFPYLECDTKGLKKVVIKFADGKNAYRELVPMCFSKANASYIRLQELLRSRYKEIARSEIMFDESFVRSARFLAAKEKLDVALGNKSSGSLNLVNPFVVFTDGQRAIILQPNVRTWTFYKTLPNISHAICSEDEGWQAQPQISYLSMAEWEAENKRKIMARDKEAEERNKNDADSL